MKRVAAVNMGMAADCTAVLPGVSVAGGGWALKIRRSCFR